MAFFLLVGTTNSFATETLMLEKPRDGGWLMQYVQVLEDKQGILSFESVLSSEKWQVLQTESLDKGFTKSVFWVRAKLKNMTNETKWYILRYGSLSRQSKVYLFPVKQRPSAQEALLSQLPHALWIQSQATLVPEVEYYLYFRVQDQQAPLVISGMILPESVMISNSAYDYPRTSFIVGGLLILSLYNLCVFLLWKDVSFLALSMFIGFFTLEMGGHAGLWHSVAWMKEYLSPVGGLFGLLCIASGISLLRHWLKTRENHPVFDVIWRAAFGGSLVLAIVSPLISFGVLYLVVLAPCLIFIGVINMTVFFRKGGRLPVSLGVALVMFLVGMVPAIARGLMLTEEGNQSEVAITGLLLALIMLSLSQAQTFRERRLHVKRTEAINQAKDEFLSVMSHELRTPLGAVVNAGQLLVLTKLAPLQLEYVSRLNISSQHMLRLINDILDFAKLRHHVLSIEQTGMQLDDLLRQLKSLLIGQAHEHDVTLILDNHFHIIGKQLVGDPVRLQQVLLNLLSNGIKFAASGEVRLCISPLKKSESGVVALLFEVTDNGIGMTQQQQKKLFQPFTQVDQHTARAYGGTGLGLAIAHKLVACMGGELRVDSEAHEGSRFHFMLSFPTEPVSLNSKNMTEVPSLAALNDTHVLLVDDNEMNRFFGGQMLESLGLEVMQVSNGDEALQYLRLHRVEMIFTDIEMPEMNGYDLTQSIRGLTYLKNTPIIALTANASAGESGRCAAAGMNGYLSKPFTREQLNAVVHQHIRSESLAS